MLKFISFLTFVLFLLSEGSSSDSGNRRKKRRRDSASVTFEIKFGGFEGKKDLEVTLDLDKCNRNAMIHFERSAKAFDINFEAQYFGELGYFISSIDGIKGNVEVGISSIELKAGDVFTWSYEPCGIHC